MKSVSLAILAVVSGSLIITACGKSDAPVVETKGTSGAAAPAVSTKPAASSAAVDPQPAQSAQTALPPAAVAIEKSDKLVIQGFSSPVPTSWTSSQPSSTMRVAQFALPAAAGVDMGELAAYFFPTGQGGSHQANIERWASQFTAMDGKPVAPKVSTSKNGDIEVTVVELQGTYARGVGMGPTGDAKPNQTLMVAMVETTIGRITLQMYGPSKTLSAQRDGFIKLAKGFRPA